MIQLKIDNKEVKVPKGISVLAAARMAGVEIPTLCYREGKEHFTSCMICMVKDAKTGKLFPSCSVKATEGMEVISRDEEIEVSRRMALELLLSDHVGDCEAPCQVTCPAHMDIPLMNRYLAKGNIAEALEVVKQDIAMPATFGRICPAPCEGACRRKSVDSAVSICLLKRFVGDSLLEGNELMAKEVLDSGKRVAIVGAGPAGLAASYYLGLNGHKCTVIDKELRAGGTLWSEVSAGKLEEEVLQKEIDLCIGRAEFLSGKMIEKAGFEQLKIAYDAVLLTVGDCLSEVTDWGLEAGKRGLVVDKETFQCKNENVFAAGSIVSPAKLAIRTHGQGKDAAYAIDLYLKEKGFVPKRMAFNSRFGKLTDSEVLEYMKEGVASDRLKPDMSGKGFSFEQMKVEAARCLHCDCRDMEDCLLRKLSDEYKAKQKHYWSEERKAVTKQIQHEYVIYEAAKCIKCGKCVHITEENKERYGMSFIGRGFDVVVGVPLGEDLSVGLADVADEVIAACPTGALSRREGKE